MAEALAVHTVPVWVAQGALQLQNRGRLSLAGVLVGRSCCLSPAATVSQEVRSEPAGSQCKNSSVYTLL